MSIEYLDFATISIRVTRNRKTNKSYKAVMSSDQRESRHLDGDFSTHFVRSK